jgi:hypothetical protein
MIRYSKTLSGLDPGTEYVAQYGVSNHHPSYSGGVSPKLYFTTYAFPTVTIDSVSPHTSATYVYADVTLE